MKYPNSLSVRTFILSLVCLCAVMVAGYLVVDAAGFPPSLRPAYWAAAISGVSIAVLLLFIASNSIRARQDASLPARKGGRRASAQFNLRECLGEALQTLEQQARERGLELSSNVLPDVPQLVVGDGTRLRQVLIRMAGYTIEFTKGGRVQVRVEKKSQGQDDCVLHFIVEEIGMATPADQRVSAPRAVSPSDVSVMPIQTATSGDQASVLQLMDLMRGRTWAEFDLQLVQKMAGRVWVDFEAGRAGCFHFTVPLGIPPASVPAEPAQDAGEKGRLVRDVDEDERAA